MIALLAALACTIGPLYTALLLAVLAGPAYWLAQDCADRAYDERRRMSGLPGVQVTVHPAGLPPRDRGRHRRADHV